MLLLTFVMQVNALFFFNRERDFLPLNPYQVVFVPKPSQTLTITWSDQQRFLTSEALIN